MSVQPDTDAGVAIIGDDARRRSLLERSRTARFGLLLLRWAVSCVIVSARVFTHYSPGVAAPGAAFKSLH